MKLLFKVSKDMTSTEGEYKLQERKTIRMTKKAREAFGLDIGTFVNVKLKDRTTATLYIDFAYDNDMKEAPEAAYVTQDVFDMLEIERNDVAIHEGITLGCDPELIFADVSTGTSADASRIFKSKSDEAGSDGVLFELRPLPSTDSNEIIETIYRLLAKSRLILNSAGNFKDYSINTIFNPTNLMMLGLSNYTDTYRTLAAGFHLHYGLPWQLLGRQKQFVATQMVRVLDYYVGIPAMIHEGENDSHRRLCTWSPYGKPGNYRVDFRTLEYRVPGAALMKHPVLAGGLLALGGIVVEDLVSRIKEATNNFENFSDFNRNVEEIKLLYPNTLTTIELMSVICSKSIRNAESLLKGIKTDIEKMVGYKRKKKEIEDFFAVLNESYPVNVEYNWWRYRNESRQSRSMDVLHASGKETS